MTPNTALTNETIQTLLSRHSVRSYKQGHKIPEEVLREILLIAGQAPSAWNLQHWKFMLIEEQADKEKLLPIAYNQKQIVDSSVTVAVLGDTEADKNAAIVYGQSVEEGLLPVEFKDRMVDQITGAYANAGPGLGRDHAFLNASLGAMQLMIAAKAYGYDSVPMSGFDSGRFAREFNVPSRYVPVMLISLGLAQEPGKATSRLPLEDIILKP